MFKCEAAEPDGKSCRLCGESKPLDDFSPRASAKDGRKSHCKTCHNRAAKLRNKERHRAASRANHLWTNYRLTVQQFDAMWAAQGGRCSICTTALTRGSRGHAIDHNHATGKVRSLTCCRCNLGIGQFLENPEFMRRAALYVEAHNI